MPAVVVLAVAINAGTLRSGMQAGNHFESLIHLRLSADDADEFLHLVLQLMLDLVRILARDSTVEGLECELGSGIHLGAIDVDGCVLLRENRGVLARSPAENQQVRKR